MSCKKTSEKRKGRKGRRIIRRGRRGTEAWEKVVDQWCGRKLRLGGGEERGKKREENKGK